jgi:hypothetical protein
VWIFGTKLHATALGLKCLKSFRIRNSYRSNAKWSEDLLRVIRGSPYCRVKTMAPCETLKPLVEPRLTVI